MTKNVYKAEMYANNDRGEREFCHFLNNPDPLVTVLDLHVDGTRSIECRVMTGLVPCSRFFVPLAKNQTFKELHLEGDMTHVTMVLHLLKHTAIKTLTVKTSFLSEIGKVMEVIEFEPSIRSLTLLCSSEGYMGSDHIQDVCITKLGTTITQSPNLSYVDMSSILMTPEQVCLLMKTARHGNTNDSTQELVELQDIFNEIHLLGILSQFFFCIEFNCNAPHWQTGLEMFKSQSALPTSAAAAGSIGGVDDHADATAPASLDTAGGDGVDFSADDQG